MIARTFTSEMPQRNDLGLQRQTKVYDALCMRFIRGGAPQAPRELLCNSQTLVLRLDARTDTVHSALLTPKAVQPMFVDDSAANIF